jgi:hypothetical protein
VQTYHVKNFIVATATLLVLLNSRATAESTLIPIALSCSAHSVDPKGLPAFNVEFNLAASEGKLSTERNIPVGGVRGFINETYEGSVGSRDEITVRGSGRNSRAGWAYEFHGRLSDTNETVLNGTQRSLAPYSGGRKCSLTLFASADQIKGRPVLRASPTPPTPTKPPGSAKDPLDELRERLGGIILAPTIDPKSWLLWVSSVPIQEPQFCRIIDRFYDDLDRVYRSRNEIQKSVLFRDRRKDIAALLPGGTFENWVVQLKEVTLTADGSAAVMLQPPCRVMLGSDACQRNSASIHATISQDSLTFRELARLSSGDFVVVSGRILYAASEDQPIPAYAIYQAGTHCSGIPESRSEEVLVTEIRYLVQIR